MTTVYPFPQLALVLCCSSNWCQSWTHFSASLCSAMVFDRKSSLRFLEEFFLLFQADTDRRTPFLLNERKKKELIFVKQFAVSINEHFSVASVIFKRISRQPNKQTKSN